MGDLLVAISGLAWIYVYVEAIRLGFREQTYAIPLWAMAFNLGWEFLYSWLPLSRGVTDLQTWTNLSWAVLDLVVAYTYFRFGHRYWPAGTPRWLPPVWGVFAIAVCALLQWAFLTSLGAEYGARVSVFLVIIVQSVLCIGMYASRQGTRGQSVNLAVAQAVSAFAGTLRYGVMEGNGLLLGVGLIGTALDLVYVWLLATDRKSQVRVTVAPAPAPSAAPSATPAPAPLT